MKEKETVIRYSIAFKLQVVRDVENSLLNADEALKLLRNRRQEYSP